MVLMAYVFACMAYEFHGGLRLGRFRGGLQRRLRGLVSLLRNLHHCITYTSLLVATLVDVV